MRQNQNNEILTEREKLHYFLFKNLVKNKSRVNTVISSNQDEGVQISHTWSLKISGVCLSVAPGPYTLRNSQTKRNKASGICASPLEVHGKVMGIFIETPTAELSLVIWSFLGQLC